MPVILVIWVCPSGTLVLGDLLPQSLDLSRKISIWRSIWHDLCSRHDASSHKCDGPRMLLLEFGCNARDFWKVLYRSTVPRRAKAAAAQHPCKITAVS